MVAAPMPRRITAVLMAGLALTGCSGNSPVPSPRPVAATLTPPARPTAATATVRAAPSVTPSATASATPPLQETTPVRVADLEVSEIGPILRIGGRLVDRAGEPVVGAVGDFYLEGATRNLIQSYATGVDGRFEATFTTAEVPSEADLMMHYRGDGLNSSGTFLIRRGIPAPTPSRPPVTPSTLPAQPADSPTPNDAASGTPWAAEPPGG